MVRNIVLLFWSSFVFVAAAFAQEQNSPNPPPAAGQEPADTPSPGLPTLPPFTLRFDDPPSPSPTAEPATPPPAPVEPSWRPKGFLSFTLQQRYVGTFTSRLLHDGWMAWTELNVQLPKGFYADLWWTYGLDDNNVNSNKGDEFEPNFGWKGKLPYDLCLHLFFRYFDFYPLDEWYDSDCWIQGAALARDFVLGKDSPHGTHTIRPELLAGYLSEVNDFIGGAAVLLPNVTYTWAKPLGYQYLTIANQVYLQYDDGFDRPCNDTGLFFRWQGGLQWQVADNVILTLPGILALVSMVDHNDDRLDEVFSFNAAVKLIF
ncbi:MAG: hypothetical protein PHI63_03375 [Patescibacteria group bacterium]|nr:hypothetical protein [Patescibacteria group bacterium]